MQKVILVILCLVSSNVWAQHPVTLVDSAGSILAKVQGKPVLQYNYTTQFPPDGKEAYYQRSGFIHPAYTPAGDTLTAGFPEKHTHHHGIFNAWVHTLFKGQEIDFWNQPDLKGTVVFSKIKSLKEKKNVARLKTEQHHLAFINGDTIAVLKETWTITIYNSTDPFIWDIEVTQKNITKNDLVLEKYHYGGMAFRGRDEWYTEPDTPQTENTIEFFTNEGKTRETANHTTPKWVTMYGTANGKEMSLTVMPGGNTINYPEFVRVHPGLPYFCLTPVVEQSYTLKPGKVFKTKYRVVTTGDRPLEEELKKVWEKFNK